MIPLLYGTIRRSILDSININPTQQILDFDTLVDFDTIVTSSSNWTHDGSTVPGWIIVVNGSGISGQNFTINCSYNAGVTRQAQIKIMLQSNNSIYQTYLVEQAGELG